MDITLQIGALDVHEKVSTYNVRREVSYSKVITTMDDTEHATRSKDRYIVETSFFPMTEAESNAYYNALKSDTVSVTFADPYSEADTVKTMRVTSDLDAAFALVSVDGKRRYKGGTVQLREI
nr:MAG TPA: hypothetical protein [Caudoviricetes sp.]